MIRNISRSNLTVVEDGEEEKPLSENERLDKVEIIGDTEGNDDCGCSLGKKCQEEGLLKDALTYTLKWGPGESDYID